MIIVKRNPRLHLEEKEPFKLLNCAENRVKLQVESSVCLYKYTASKNQEKPLRNREGGTALKVVEITDIALSRNPVRSNAVNCLRRTANFAIAPYKYTGL
jgi:hypothetical protein